MSIFSRLFHRTSSDAEKGIQRYGEATGKREVSRDAATHLPEITAHVEKHWGKIESVFHELASEYVHVDVLWVKPSGDRDFHVLVTSGMSDRPMKTPKEARDYRLAELLICLPADWPVSEEAFKEERNYWPVRWLKQVARFAHEYRTWFGVGHTIPNGDPPEPFADNTRFCCWILGRPILGGEAAAEIKTAKGETIHLYSLIPMYPEETAYKLEHGAEAFFEKYAGGMNTEKIDIQRRNLCVVTPPFVPEAGDSALVTARKFFDRWLALANAFDPAVTDLYADECRITYRQRQQDGQVKTKQLDGKQIKTLVKMMLTAARPRSEPSFTASDVVFVEEGGGVRVRGKKHNPQKNSSGEFSALLQPDQEGMWWIVEETSDQ